MFRGTGHGWLHRHKCNALHQCPPIMKAATVRRCYIENRWGGPGPLDHMDDNVAEEDFVTGLAVPADVRCISRQIRLPGIREGSANVTVGIPWVKIPTFPVPDHFGNGIVCGGRRLIVDNNAAYLDAEYAGADVVIARNREISQRIGTTAEGCSLLVAASTGYRRGK